MKCEKWEKRFSFNISIPCYRLLPVCNSEKDVKQCVGFKKGEGVACETVQPFKGYSIHVEKYGGKSISYSIKSA